MISKLSLLLLCGVISTHLGYAQKLPKVKKLNMKVHINITGETLVMKFHRPNEALKLEGFILGYGSNYFSNQYIQWPDNGKPYITDVDAETRYLIAVKPNENHKKMCKDKNSVQKPLQLVIGTMTPTSVYLSWGILINPQVDWSALSKCPNDRFYTVRYREKNKDWNFQLCPSTETVVDNLKPNTMYEFGVKDNTDDALWSKCLNFKTIPKGKENGHIENSYKIPKGTLQYASEDTKALIPVMIVKQGFQNISKSAPAPPPTELSPVFREETKKPPLTTTRPSTPRPKAVSKITDSPPVTKSPEKPGPEDPKPAGVILLSFDEQQVSTETPIKLHTSSGSHPTSTVATKLSTHLPFQRRTTLLATMSKNVPAKQTTQLFQPLTKTTTAFIGRDNVITTPQSIARTAVAHPVPATMGKNILVKQSTQLFQPLTKTTTAFIGRDNVVTTPQSIARTAVAHPVPVPTEMSLFHPKPSPGTEESDSEDDSTQPDSEIISTDTPHTYEPETSTLVSDEQTDLTVVQTLTSKPKPHTKIAYRITSIPFTTNTPTTSKKKKSTQAPKSKQTSTVQPKITLPKQTQPTDVFKTTKPAKLIEETTITVAETQTIPPKKAFSTVGPVPQFVPGKMEKAVSSKSEKTSQRPPTTAVPKPAQTIKMPINLIRIHIFDNEDLPTVTEKNEKPVSSILEKTSQRPPTTAVPKPEQTKKMPINLIRLHIFGDPELPSVTERTEKDVSSILEKTSQSPPTTAVPKPAQTKKMPINLIRLHIFDDPALPTVESETQSTSPSIPKITQSNKMSEPKLAPKTTQKAPIHLIRLHIFEDPDISTVPNTTLTPTQSSTTLKLQTPNPTPVPTQKVSQQKTQKPKPTPRNRTKPASTARTKDTTTKPKISHVTAPTTLAPYKVQQSSSRPRTSLRPRTRPAQNGTTQGTIRPRPTGDFNWAPGTIPGGRVLDSTKLLGVSRNISMEPNNTGKKIFSVSATPLPPVRPTSTRKRIPASNVTGRPSVTVSSPPLSTVKPTNIRRKPPINGTSRPATAGGILIPRAPSTARPNCTMVSKKPTIPAPDEDFVDPTVFSPSPKSDIDALGQPRYTAPHVKYVSKEDNIPCSITETLRHFPTEEGTNQEALIPPQNPPSNLSVVTVEGCPSFVILDWEQPDNDTVTEYKVISTENGAPTGKDQSITTTNQTYSTVENLKPNTSYEFKVVPKNPLGEGPVSTTVEFNTESADPRVSEPVTGGKDAIWTSIKFKSDSYSECKGKQFVKRTWYKKFVGIQLCNSLRYKIYLSDTLTGTFYNIGDQSGYGEDHCQFVDSFLDGRTGQQLLPEQLTTRKGFYRSVRQQPVEFGEIGGRTHISYVHWYECGIAIPGKW